jgi:DNA-binding Xre family transcriptional regulator
MVLMIRVRLREAIKAYSTRSGKRLTYAQLSELAGVSRATIESLAARPGYNATLDLIDKLCAALECSPAELLERVNRDSEQRCKSARTTRPKSNHEFSTQGRLTR